MILSVMQPYLFPYIGYYQLVFNSDKFVFYDDVTFIKGGYINRNNILSSGKPNRFSLPVLKQSSNKNINELFFDNNVKKILKTISQSYSKAPYFSEVYPILVGVFDSEDRRVSTLCASSIISIFKYLDIEKECFLSSDLDYNRNLSASDKLIEMSRVFNADTYTNTIGGMNLYNKSYFDEHGIHLQFLKTSQIKYYQDKSDNFMDNLSIIDVLMWNSKSEVRNLLLSYDII